MQYNWRTFCLIGFCIPENKIILLQGQIIYSDILRYWRGTYPTSDNAYHVLHLCMKYISICKTDEVTLFWVHVCRNELEQERTKRVSLIRLVMWWETSTLSRTLKIKDKRVHTLKCCRSFYFLNLDSVDIID